MSSILAITKDLALIAAKATTLAERLNNSLLTNSISNDDPQVQTRLEQWCQVVAKGNSAKFHERLAWDGLDVKTLMPILTDVVLVDDQFLPSWVNTLEQILQTSQKISHKQLFSQERYLSSENPVPFEHFYVSCIQTARQKLCAIVGSKSQLLSETALITLERSLLERLANICTPTLFKEFSDFRSPFNPLKVFLLLPIQWRNSQDKYRAFILKLYEDGLLSFFQEYSVLARLVSTVVDFWVETTAEFIDRLATDWYDIEQRFNRNAPLKQVEDIKASLSDTHNQGRSVIALKFDTGLKLVYKPKELALDFAFYNFLSWYNQHSTQPTAKVGEEIDKNDLNDKLTFKIIQVLNRSTHGWVEFVEHQSCEDEAAVKRFYKRSGMLICLVYVLGGTDCHYENLIASGEHLVLVDLETLLNHHVYTLDLLQKDASGLTEKLIAQSVLSTAMLPQKGLFLNDNYNVDITGLGGVGEQSLSVQKLDNINTDAMDLGYEKVSVKQTNGATLNGISLSPKDYLQDIVEGFEQMYYFFISHREPLLAADSPLISFANQKVRHVFRNTNTYALILQHSCAPHLLRHGIDRSIGLDVLSRAYLTTEEKPVFWQMLSEELQAMEQLDIPLLVANSSSDSLALSTGVVSKVFIEPSFNLVIKRIQNLSVADLTQQVDIILGCFYSRFVEEPKAVVFPQMSSSTKTQLSLDAELLVQKAISIAEELQQRAIYHANDGAAWLGTVYNLNTQSFKFSEVSYSLYEGASGIALFLAALAKITGEEQWRKLALSALQPLRDTLLNSSPEDTTRLIGKLGISGSKGLSSIVYSLVRISQLLEPTLLQDAQKIASFITPELIATDNRFDVIGGSAGVLLSLLALYDCDTTNKQQAPAPLELAIACGKHLLKNRISINDNPRAWKTWEGKQLTGFSQGAAGIAYALLRLFNVSQDTRFLDAAIEAISYEQSVFCTNAQNWLDIRSEEPISRVTWAHGAAGIGLGRLGGLSVLDTPEIHQQIAIALETTQKFLISDVDNLCWGNLGRVETLLVATRKLERPELLTVVHQAVSKVISQAQTQGTFNLFPNLPPKVYNPGFFHGTAGIGYQLLRIAYPDVLPSVLLWE